LPLDHTDLREMKKRRDIEGLVNILETGDIKECREAICMLGELKNRKAINPLIGFLETDDIQVRSNAAWALGEIGHVKAVLPLIGILNDPIENVRINAAWSLGRIGDKRALPVLRSAMKNGSTDLRKHAREAIARIESNGNDTWRNSQDADISDTVDIPLIAIEVHSNMECNYISRVEDDESQTDYENMASISRNVQIRDTIDSDEDTRKIILGLKDDSRGLVSVDILFRYKSGETKSSSVWLQMSNIEANGDHKSENSREIKRIPGERIKRKTKIKNSRKPVEYDLPVENGFDQFENSEIDSNYAEDYPDERNKKIITRREKRPVTREIPEEQESGYEEEIIKPVKRSRKMPDDELDIETQEISVPTGETRHEAKQVKDPIIQPVPPKQQEQPKLREIRPEVKQVNDPTVQPVPPKPKELPKPRETRPEAKQVNDPTVQPVPPKPPGQEVKLGDQVKGSGNESKTEPVIGQVKQEIKPIVAEQSNKPASAGNVDSAVRLLSDIGMSGMTNAASTVTQLSGEEAESPHSLLRTLPIEEMKDEITSLGDSIVMIGVELHGHGPEGEVKGQMQLYLSSQNALEVANELLCNTPDTELKEFTDDIISTLKETANIFGGQYISAISEYIGVALSLKTPSFKTGQSAQIAEAQLKDITGKVDFALSTNIPFGNNRTGHLIMLVDPKSFEIIIQKLF
jgi:chemotaxis protein CheY-P-specific phosphatase CheC